MKKLLTLLLAFSLTVSPVVAEDLTGTVQVTATVLGDKPQVNNLTVSTGSNNAATPIEIIGRNFGVGIASVLGISLDDPSATALDYSTPSLASSCDLTDTHDACSGTGSYQIIKGFSVPAGLIPGTYNVLVTTASGTNMISDVKFTVTQAVSTATPVISNLYPTYISFMEGVAGESLTMTATVSDSDTSAVNFLVTDIPTAQISIPSGTSQVVNAGESASFPVQSIGTSAEGFYTFNINADDEDTSAPYDDTKIVNVFIDPAW